MEMSTDLAVDLQQLTSVLGGSPPGHADLQSRLRTLTEDAVIAVRSFLGLSVTLSIDGQDVTVTSMSGLVELSDVRSSLRVPLHAVSPNLNGHVVFYAGRTGAFRQLAADLRAELGGGQAAVELVEGPLDTRAGSLGADSSGAGGSGPRGTVATVVSGITGAAEMSSVNRAVGLLIGRGYTPEDARARLQEEAARAMTPLHATAQQLLDQASASASNPTAGP
jgi:hypothetical protein